MIPIKLAALPDVFRLALALGACKLFELLFGHGAIHLLRSADQLRRRLLAALGGERCACCLLLRLGFRGHAFLTASILRHRAEARRRSHGTNAFREQRFRATWFEQHGVARSATLRVDAARAGSKRGGRGSGCRGLTEQSRLAAVAILPGAKPCPRNTLAWYGWPRLDDTPAGVFFRYLLIPHNSPSATVTAVQKSPKILCSYAKTSNSAGDGRWMYH